MLDWLFEAIFNWIANFLASFFDAVMKLFSDTVSYDVSTFYSSFDYTTKSGAELFSEMYDKVIVPAATSILLLLLVWNLYKSMATQQIADVEEPQYQFMRAGIGLIFIWNCQKILNLPIAGFQKLLDVIGMDGISKNSFDIVDMIKDNGIPILNVSTNESTNIAIRLVVLLMLFWVFIELMFVYIQRYTAYCIYLFLSPLAFSGMGSKGSMEITKRCIKLYTAVILSILLTTMWMKLYCTGIVAFFGVKGNGADSGKYMILGMIVYSFGKFGFKMDEFLTKAGLLTVTPTSMMQLAFGARTMMMGTPVAKNVFGHMMNGASVLKDVVKDSFKNKGGDQLGIPVSKDIHSKTNTGDIHNNTSVKDDDQIISQTDVVQNANDALDGNMCTDPAKNKANAEALFGKKQSVGSDGKAINSHNPQANIMSKPDKNGKVSAAAMYKDASTGKWGIGKNMAPIDMSRYADSAGALGRDAKHMNMGDVNKVKDAMNEMMQNKDMSKLTGLTRNADGSSNAWEITPNGNGDFNVKSGNKSYGSLQQAAEAAGADSVTFGQSSGIMDKDSVDENGKVSSSANVFGRDAKHMNMADVNKVKDAMNEMMQNKDMSKLTGLTRNADGSSNAWEITPNGNGDFNVKSGNKSYGSLQQAAEAAGADSVIFGQASTLDTSSPGSISEGLNKAAGITDQGGIPGVSDYKVTAMGNGNINGVYADSVTGQIGTFRGSVIDNDTAKQQVASGKSNVIPINGGRYMSIQKEAGSAKYSNAVGMYHVNEHGKVVANSNVHGLDENGQAV